MTLAVDGKICTHLETGLSHDIADGKVSDTPTRADYFTAGALKETDVDYVFNNVGFSSASALYALPLREDVRERAEQTLAQRSADQPERDTFSIYQVPAGPQGRDFRYRPYEELQAAGLAVDRKNYALVYTAPLDGKTTLENIYRTFNTDDRPADFRGHSLSVSDVVVINRGGKEEAHYCDSIGFTPVPEFIQESHIKTAEMSTEQNYNMIDGTLNNAPSMGELEARAKAEKPKQNRTASKTAQRQKKPSIRAQLKAAKEEQAKKPPQRERSKELEV